MSNLKIFLSKKEDYINSAIKIKEKSPIKTEIIYMEDFLQNTTKSKLQKTDFVYFLTNETQIKYVINKIEKDYCCFIFNKEFLKSNYKKDEVQKILKFNNIPIPEIILMENLEKENFPIFCKQKKHTGITFQTYNHYTITSFFEKFNKDDFYLEKALLDEESITKETKVYYICGKIFFKDNMEYEFSEKLQDLCNKISNSLNNIEIFSADFITISNKYYIIDLNPASGFYLSKNARNEWFKIMEKKILLEV